MVPEAREFVARVPPRRPWLRDNAMGALHSQKQNLGVADELV